MKQAGAAGRWGAAGGSAVEKLCSGVSHDLKKATLTSNISDLLQRHNLQRNTGYRAHLPFKRTRWRHKNWSLQFLSSFINPLCVCQINPFASTSPSSLQTLVETLHVAYSLRGNVLKGQRVLFSTFDRRNPQWAPLVHQCLYLFACDIFLLHTQTFNQLSLLFWNGIIHGRDGSLGIKISPFLLLTCVLMEALVTFLKPHNHSWVSQKERIPPTGSLLWPRTQT